MIAQRATHSFISTLFLIGFLSLGIAPFSLAEDTPVDNDTCENAIGHLTLGTVVEGTTLGATSDNTTACGTDFETLYGGVWYTFIGDGKTVTASTCHGDPSIPIGEFDTHLKVYTGNCGTLECVAGNDDDGVIVSAEILPAAAMDSISHNVSNRELAAAENHGSIRGAVEAERELQGTCGEGSIGNGVCSDGRCCSQWGWCGEQAQYCKTGNDDDVGDACSLASAVTWDSVEGQVYYIVVEGVFDFSAGRFGLVVAESTPTPPPTPPPTYAPVDNDSCDNAIGPLALGTVVEGTTLGAANDNTTACGTTFEQLYGGVWYSFIGDGNTVIASTCHEDPNIPVDEFDTHLKVFSGNCGALECVAGNDDDLGDACGLSSGVIWDSVEGQVYYILVEGVFEYSAGRFGLVVTKWTPPPPVDNDICENAVGLLTLGAVVDGTTLGATSDNTTACGTDFEQLYGGVWYTFIGDGNTVIASTCHEDPNIPVDEFDTHLKVFTGNCGKLECVAGNDDDENDACGLASGVVWDSAEGQVYYILVESLGEFSGGRFGLVVAESTRTPPPTYAPVENDVCNTTISLVAGEAVQGSTIGASNDLTLECGAAPTQESSGVWYKYVGSGFTAEVSTCPSFFNGISRPSFDTAIKVYTGSCLELECVDGNDDQATDNCGSASGVSFLAEEGKEYFILVHGYGSDTGNFSLILTEEIPPPPTVAPLPGTNDKCEDAIGPLVLGTVMQGTTFGATNDNTGICGTALNQTSAGVWYTFIGNDQKVKASTCHGNRTIAEKVDNVFDTQVKVYTGSCGALECVTGNDDDYHDDCRTGSGAVWNAEAGKEYFILVHGFDENRGAFGIGVTEE